MLGFDCHGGSRWVQLLAEIREIGISNLEHLELAASR